MFANDMPVVPDDFANRGDAGVVHDDQGCALKVVNIFLFDV